MSLQGKRIFVRKSGGGNLYKWSPTSDITNNKNNVKQNVETCTALQYQVNGNDSFNDYVIKKEFTHILPILHIMHIDSPLTIRTFTPSQTPAHSFLQLLSSQPLHIQN